MPTEDLIRQSLSMERKISECAEEKRADIDKEGVILSVNYTYRCCGSGHVWVEAFQSDSKDPSLTFDFDVYQGMKSKPALLSVPLYVQKINLAQIDAAYRESFFQNKQDIDSSEICYCVLTNNCADSANHALIAAGFDLESTKGCSWVTCIRSSYCPTSDSCCCCVPTCGCSIPQDTVEFAYKTSLEQMASDPKVGSFLKEKYAEYLKKNDVGEQDILQVMYRIDRKVTQLKAKHRFFKEPPIQGNVDAAPEMPVMSTKN